MGKLTQKELQKLLMCIKKAQTTLVHPQLGYDSGVHLLDDKYVVVSTDPCTGVPKEWFGWLLINYTASDVALFGAKPAFCTINLLAPLGTTAEVFQKVMKQACHAADELEIAIVAGHTATYTSLNDIIGVCTIYGTVKPEKLRTPAKAETGDLILCTKILGYETLVNFALTHKKLSKKLFGTQVTRNIINHFAVQSCVQEALQLAEIKGVHAMHDVTEGGLVTALNEFADAANLGFRIESEKLPVNTEIQKLQRYFGLSDWQVLAMSSTGTLLAAVAADAKDEVQETLHKLGVDYRFVGTFTTDKKRVLIKNLKDKPFPRIAHDPYAEIVANKK
ncbi:MAG: AIR synthase-related protein [Candidatus Bathyarchaeota archaeon]|nr:AIR synthase-related protein [Candidatus Bathyarchaeota archaeon]